MRHNSWKLSLDSRERSPCLGSMTEMSSSISSIWDFRRDSVRGCRSKGSFLEFTILQGSGLRKELRSRLPVLRASRNSVAFLGCCVDC